MNKITNITEAVKKVLIASLQSRDNDNVLYLEILKIADINQYTPISAVLTAIDQKYLPSFASVLRIKRILQRKNEALRGETYKINPLH